MAELSIQNGDYVTDGAGGLRRAEGAEALLQRVAFRLRAHRGQFPFQETLGSDLWKLGRMSAAVRESAAEQMVAEALANEKDLLVDHVTMQTDAEGVSSLTAALDYKGERLSLTMKIQ